MSKKSTLEGVARSQIIEKEEVDMKYFIYNDLDRRCGNRVA